MSLLRSLDLEKNPVSRLSDYKVKVFSMLPQLKALDGHNKYGEIVFSDEEEDSQPEEGGEVEFSEDLGDDRNDENVHKNMSARDYMRIMQGGEGGEDDLSDEYGESIEGSPTKRQRVD